MNRYYSIPTGIQEILVVFICYKDFVPTGTKLQATGNSTPERLNSEVEAKPRRLILNIICVTSVTDKLIRN